MQAERARDSLTNARAVRAPARAPRWVVPSVKAALVGVDLALSLVAFLTAFYYRQGVPIIERVTNGNVVWSHQFAPYAVLLPFVLLIRALLMGYYDLYRVGGEFSFVEDAARAFRAVAIGSLLI